MSDNQEYKKDMLKFTPLEFKTHFDIRFFDENQLLKFTPLEFKTL